MVCLLLVALFTYPGCLWSGSSGSPSGSDSPGYLSPDHPHPRSATPLSCDYYHKNHEVSCKITFPESYEYMITCPEWAMNIWLHALSELWIYDYMPWVSYELHALSELWIYYYMPWVSYEYMITCPEWAMNIWLHALSELWIYESKCDQLDCKCTFYWVLKFSKSNKRFKCQLLVSYYFYVLVFVVWRLRWSKLWPQNAGHRRLIATESYWPVSNDAWNVGHKNQTVV